MSCILIYVTTPVHQSNAKITLHVYHPGSIFYEFWIKRSEISAPFPDTKILFWHSSSPAVLMDMGHNLTQACSDELCLSACCKLELIWEESCRCRGDGTQHSLCHLISSHFHVSPDFGDPVFPFRCWPKLQSSLCCFPWPVLSSLHLGFSSPELIKAFSSAQEDCSDWPCRDNRTDKKIRGCTNECSQCMRTDPQSILPFVSRLMVFLTKDEADLRSVLLHWITMASVSLIMVSLRSPVVFTAYSKRLRLHLVIIGTLVLWLCLIF